MNTKRFTLFTVMSIAAICCSSCGRQGELTKIVVTEMPKKTVYKVGEKFDTKGMVVTGTFKDSENGEIYTDEYDDYYYWCGDSKGKLRLSDKTVRITDTNNYNSKIYTTISITVQNDGPTPDPGDYYEGINENSKTLLNDLHSLNEDKIDHLVGYGVMLNSPAKGYYITDPGEGSNTITTFYSGRNNQRTKGLNREHVWPDSRGGNLVEDDIHMPRPTLSSENGSRGNSFYVEGKCSSSGGWDPAMEDFGDETYRGDSARIIFYCAIANLSLKIIDKDTDNTSNNTMGKLSDLLKWNLRYPVTQREITRNEGAEQLQGNRNPFIDHPEYACKIWGDTNSTTRSICGM